MSACCRFCGSTDLRLVVSLGMSPLANSNIAPERLNHYEPFFPLDVKICAECMLVQLEEYESPSDIFSDYVYFSSWSSSWVAHAKRYVDAVVPRFNLSAESQVIEIASNDGYLLQWFQGHGVPVLGIEPAANVAEVAREKGIETRVSFWGADFARGLAAEGIQADLLLGNNVLAHVPDLNGFVKGLAAALKSNGVVTMEFPHLLQLIEHNQFDTIYHEHFSYFSLAVVQKVFEKAGLAIFDVEELPTHGGSLRIYAKHAEDDTHPVEPGVASVLAKESETGLSGLSYYETFAEKVYRVKRELLSFLIRAREQGKRVVGYGAPAKGNTLLNYCGIRTDLLEYTCDLSKQKQGLFTPGTRIPILSPEQMVEDKPDFVLILPWNLQEEIMEQWKVVRSWGGKFVVPIPEVRVLD